MDQYVSERIANRKGQSAKRNNADGDETDTAGFPIRDGDQPNSQRGVREPSVRGTAASDNKLGVTRPAHPSNCLVARLNEAWRVIDDPLQWILQREKGNPRKKNSGLRGRSFCRTREALLRCICQYCGEVHGSALAKLQALPDWHPDWDRKKKLPNLDVRGTDQAQGDRPSKTRVAWELEERRTHDQPSHPTLRPLT